MDIRACIVWCVGPGVDHALGLQQSGVSSSASFRPPWREHVRGGVHIDHRHGGGVLSRSALETAGPYRTAARKVLSRGAAFCRFLGHFTRARAPSPGARRRTRWKVRVNAAWSPNPDREATSVSGQRRPRAALGRTRSIGALRLTRARERVANLAHGRDRTVLQARYARPEPTSDRVRQRAARDDVAAHRRGPRSGFGDQAAFTRTFHRVVGVAPGRWRREHRVEC